MVILPPNPETSPILVPPLDVHPTPTRGMNRDRDRNPHVTQDGPDVSTSNLTV